MGFSQFAPDQCQRAALNDFNFLEKANPMPLEAYESVVIVNAGATVLDNMREGERGIEQLAPPTLPADQYPGVVLLYNTAAAPRKVSHRMFQSLDKSPSALLQDVRQISTGIFEAGEYGFPFVMRGLANERLEYILPRTGRRHDPSFEFASWVFP